MASVPFNNLITFSRGSNATLTGPDGLIQWAPNNLVTFSEQFDNSAWTKLGSTITANTTVSPDGTTTADTQTATATSGVYVQITVGALTNGQNYTVSRYVKAGTKAFCTIGMFGLADAYFDLANLTTSFTGTGAVSASITDVGNGWRRISATWTWGAGTTYRLFFAMASSLSSQSGITVGDTLFLWGAQLELGSAATTYNSTTVKNLLGFSEAFDNAAWTKSNASIVTGAQANPVNGAFNAQKLMENTAASVGHYILQSPTAIAGTAYTTVIYAKAAERNWLHIFEDSGGSIYGFFNLSTGATGAVNNATASITNIGSGWYRCSLTYTQIGSIARIRYGVTTGNAVFTYTGDGNSGIYIYGAQLSDSASLDPYVPTPAAAPSSTAYYGPRFDYDPVTLAPKGLLVEEARTNLATYSQQFDNAAWLKTATATVTANTSTAPDGTTTADTLNMPASGDRINLSDIAITGGTTYTASLWLSGSGTTFISLASSGGTYTFAAQQITLTATPTRYTVSLVTNANNTSVFPIIGRYNGAVGAGTATSAVIWGYQLEAGAFATSYIPTVASTVTRSADVATISGSLFSQWYAQSEGTFVVQATVPTDVDSPVGNFYLAASDGTIANQIILADVSGTVGQIQTGGVLQFNNSVGAEPTGVLKASIAFQTNNTTICAGGTLGTLDTSVTLPTVNRFLIGIRGDSNSTSLLNGHIRSIDFIPARAADFQLQVLST